MTYLIKFFSVFLGYTVVFPNVHRSPKDMFNAFIEKKNPCITGHMQFKPMLLKDQLYPDVLHWEALEIIHFNHGMLHAAFNQWPHLPV